MKQLSVKDRHHSVNWSRDPNDPSCQYLRISVINEPYIKEYPCWKTLSGLIVDSWWGPSRLDTLANLAPNLIWLSLGMGHYMPSPKNASTLSSLRGIEKLSSLQLLELGGASSLKTLTPLAKVSTLRHLALEYCPSIKELTPLTNLPLKTICLRACTGLRTLETLPTATVETCIHNDMDGRQYHYDHIPGHIDLSNAKSLQSLRGLHSLRGLKELILQNCSSLKNLDGLEGLKELQVLDLRGCTSLTDASALKDCPNLRVVAIWNTPLSKKDIPRPWIASIAKKPKLSELKKRPLRT